MKTKKSAILENVSKCVYALEMHDRKKRTFVRNQRKNEFQGVMLTFLPIKMPVKCKEKRSNKFLR